MPLLSPCYQFVERTDTRRRLAIGAQLIRRCEGWQTNSPPWAYGKPMGRNVGEKSKSSSNWSSLFKQDFTVNNFGARRNKCVIPNYLPQVSRIPGQVKYMNQSPRFHELSITHPSASMSEQLLHDKHHRTWPRTTLQIQRPDASLSQHSSHLSGAIVTSLNR